MKSRIQQLSRGIIEYQVPEPVFEPSALSGNLFPGKRMTVDLQVRSANGVPFRLYLYSPDFRVAVPKQPAAGRNVRISLEVSTSGLTEGDTVDGSIAVLFNGGEYMLPYHFTVGSLRKDEYSFSFRKLRDFHEYAVRNPEEAVSLFSSPDFPELPFMQDLHLQGLYRCYSVPSASRSALREFFREAGMTDPFPPAEKRPLLKTAAPESLSPSDAAAYKNFRIMRFLLSVLRFLRGSEEHRKTWYDNEIARLLDTYPKDTEIRLLSAYYQYATGNSAISRAELIRLQDQVQKERTEKKDRYCLFILLAGLVQNDAERTDAARRLIHKYYSDGSASLLLTFLEYRTNPLYREQPEEALSFLRRLYDKGVRSRLFLQELVFLREDCDPPAPVMTEQELYAMLYGLRHGIVSERGLFSVLSGELKNTAYLPLYMLILRLGYRRFKNLSLLQAVVNVFLQQKGTSPQCYIWYREAIARNVSMNGLYEYFLLSMPKKEGVSIPREVMRHFGLMREHSGLPRDLLYHAAVTEYRDDEEIRILYENPVRNFGLGWMKKAEYTALTVPVIRAAAVPEELSEETAEGMTEFFHVREVRSTVRDARKVVVSYPQLTKEMSFPMEDGKGYVPLFSSKAILAFEDAGGTRFADPGKTVSPVLEDEILYRSARAMVQETLLLRLSEADRLMEEGIRSEEEAVFVRELSRDRRLSDYFRARLSEKLIECGRNIGEKNKLLPFLKEIDFGSLKKPYRTELLNLLIGEGQFEAAYRRVLEYGFETLPDEPLSVLADSRLRDPQAGNDPVLYAAFVRLYLNGNISADGLSYLTAFFSGAVREMMGLLRTVRKKRIQADALIERTFVRCFFTGNELNMDTLFEWYGACEKQDDALIRAYLVLKSHRFFTEGRKLTDKAVSVLRRRVFSLPEVAGFAMLSRLSEMKDSLSPDDTALAEQLLQSMASKNIVLGCFSGLSGKVRMPEELEGRVFVEYRDRTAREVVIAGTIFPVRRYFHRTMHEVYPGIFTRSFVLYRQEWIQYYFSVYGQDGQAVEKEGGVASREQAPLTRGGLYEDIEALEKYTEKTDLRDSAELVRSLVLKNGMIKDLFREI